MPILSYKCDSCGKEFAKIFVDTQDAPKKCPVCNSFAIKEKGQAFRVDSGLFTRIACASCDTCDSCSAPTGISIGSS